MTNDHSIPRLCTSHDRQSFYACRQQNCMERLPAWVSGMNFHQLRNIFTFYWIATWIGIWLLLEMGTEMLFQNMLNFKSIICVTYFYESGHVPAVRFLNVSNIKRTHQNCSSDYSIGSIKTFFDHVTWFMLIDLPTSNKVHQWINWENTEITKRKLRTCIIAAGPELMPDIRKSSGSLS